MRFGIIVAVAQRSLGTTLAEPAGIGDTSLTVDDVGKLGWPTGGARIGNQPIIYSVDAAPDQEVASIDLDEEPEGYDEEGTLSIVPPLNAAYGIDEPVLQFQGQIVSERVATMMFHESNEQMELRVPRHLWDRLPVGIRLREGAAETVSVENIEGQWVITDVVDEAPDVDGSYLNSATLPAQVERPATAGADVAGFFAEAWTAPGAVVSSNGVYAHAVGTGIADPPVLGNTGFKWPTVAYQDVSVGTINWNVMELAIGPSDGIGAASVAVSGANTRYLGAIWFNFNVPVGATINGITVVITRDKVPPKTVTDNSVRLLKAQVPVGADRANTLHWPDSMTGIQYGGASDLWGTTWTPADINDVGFGVAISADLNDGAAAEVDSFRIKVNYTIPATTARSNTHFLAASDFLFAIPDEATIVGVQATIKRHASDNSGDDYVVDNQVRLQNPAGESSEDRSGNVRWPTADVIASYGGDLWGLSELTPAEVNDPDFTLLISANVQNGVTAYIDAVTVTVAYVLGGDA